eukprot:3106214-Pyramimonas_sp.AAC.1
MRWGTESRVVHDIVGVGKKPHSELKAADLRIAADKSRVLGNSPVVRASIASKLRSLQPLP